MLGSVALDWEYWPPGERNWQFYRHWGLVYAPRWLVYPLAEEPWLREQYGAAYEEYAATVPRFLGRGSLRRLIDDVSGSGRSKSD